MASHLFPITGTQQHQAIPFGEQLNRPLNRRPRIDQRHRLLLVPIVGVTQPPLMGVARSPSLEQPTLIPLREPARTSRIPDINQDRIPHHQLLDQFPSKRRGHSPTRQTSRPPLPTLTHIVDIPLTNAITLPISLYRYPLVNARLPLTANH